MEILIVDDSMIVQVMLKKVLEKMGHSTICVASGEEGLKILLEENSIGLAIIDWEMPGISGLDVCKQVCQANLEKHPYLILLTANDSKEHIEEAYQAGADQFLIKPFDNKLLEHHIKIAEEKSKTAQ